MRLRSCLAVLLAAVLAACTNPTEPTPTPNVTVIQQVTVGSGGPGGPSPSPGPGATCGTVATLRVGFFGIACPAGVAPRNGQGVLPLGCLGIETATPKSAQGTDVPAAVHGPLIAWGVTTGPDRVRLVEVEEPFNRNVIPQALGDVVITATNTPPSCSPVTGTHTFQVTAATSSGSGDVVALAVPEAGAALQLYRDPDGAYLGEWHLGDPVLAMEPPRLPDGEGK